MSFNFFEAHRDARNAYLIRARRRRHQQEWEKIRLSEARSTSAHDFALAYELGVELGTVECEVNVKINAVKCTLGCIHALKVFFKVLAAEVRGESDHFLDAWYKVSVLCSLPS
jgi:hypothetical protein